jgi:hypothetical protein
MNLEDPFNPVGDATMTLRRLIAPMTFAILVIGAGATQAQNAFPAPLPGQVGTANDPAFPPVNNSAPSAMVGAPPFPSDDAPLVGGGLFAQDCMGQFMPLREEAERRGKMIKEASDRHATPGEACGLIANFVQAEVKMINYVEKNSASCGIPKRVSDQLKDGHKNTEALRARVCALQQRFPKDPTGDFEPVSLTLSDVLGPPARQPAGPTGDFGR